MTGQRLMTAADLTAWLQKWGMKPIEGAKVLRIQKSKMSEYQSTGANNRPIPDYIAVHVETFEELSKAKARNIIASRLASPGCLMTPEAFKAHLRSWGIIPIEAAKVLGIHKSKVSGYQTAGPTNRPVPPYIAAHIESFEELSVAKALMLIKSRLGQSR